MREITHLKPYKSMDTNEKMAYLDELKNWSENNYVELKKIGNAWEASALKSFDDGLSLLSAFSQAIPFIDSALKGDARRFINRMGDYLEMIKKETNLDKVMTRSSADKTDYIGAVPAIGTDGADGKVTESIKKQIDEIVSQYTDDTRPQHIAEYKHLLSPELQAKVETIAPLRASQAKHAELAKEMSNHGVKESTVKAECDKALAYMNQLIAIYDACDAEYAAAMAKDKAEAAAQGGKAKPEGEAAPAPESQGESTTTVIDPKKAKGAYTKAEIDALPDSSFKGECKTARIKANRTYIKRKDVKNKAELSNRINELVAWGELTQDDAEATLLASENPQPEVPGAVASGSDSSDSEGDAE